MRMRQLNASRALRAIELQCSGSMDSSLSHAVSQVQGLIIMSVYAHCYF